MRFGLFFSSLVPLMGLAAALPAGFGEANEGLDNVPFEPWNDTTIAAYNQRQAATAALYPRLVHGSQFSRRFLSLFKRPKPGVSYSALDGITGKCKSAEDIEKDVKAFTKHYSFIRLYSPDCDQVKNVHAAAKKHEMQLFLGVFNHDKIAEEVKQMAAQLKGDWSIVDTVAIGNEMMLKGLNPTQILGKLAEGRKALHEVGYHPDKVKHAKIVLVEVWWHSLENPAFCEDSDYCTVNFHPYFDQNHGTDKAGEFMLNSVKKMRDKFKKNKRIHITETGWPTKDGPNNRDPLKAFLHGRASVANQKKVLQDIKKVLGGKPGELILMSPYDDKWKQAKGPEDHVEKWWGIVE